MMQRRENLIYEAIKSTHLQSQGPEFTAVLDQSMSYRIEQSGVMDSGANISVTNPIVVARYGLKIHK